MKRFTLAVLLLGLSSSLGAATVPRAFVDKPFVSGMVAPTAMAFAPDGRLFVCEQTGAVRVIENDVLLPAAFVTLTVDFSGERGLLGIAFDPNFAVNQFLYVYYTVPSPAHNRISRFTASGNVAVPGSELIILDLNNLSIATNHNGGAIHFGPDGKLYAAVGENANAGNAQLFTNLLGKMLRINPDPANLIPTDNPYFNDMSVVGVNKAIWALGLRNPFTFTFQPGTGRMFINDVGQVTWEEINEGVAHSNYGWPICEGLDCSSAPPIDYRPPLYSYHHNTGTPTGCAIVGGAFYNPPAVQYPSSYIGQYFFADLCSGFIRYVDPNGGNPIPSSTAFATGINSPVDILVGREGSLYYLTHGGSVQRVVFGSNAEKNFDFERDGKADLSVWRPPFGFWYAQRSFDGTFYSTQWGQVSDVLVPGDYDGDGRTDAAVWRPSDGTWYIMRTRTGTSIIRQFGVSSDVPVPGDYDGDGTTDMAVFRPGNATWYVFRSSNSALMAQPFGLSSDRLVPGDFDLDGKTDFAVWRESEGMFYALNSFDSTLFARQFGTTGDKVVLGDYDNDGVTDTAVNRPSSSIWYVFRSSDSGFVAQPFGLSSDTLTPGDYDGDGKTDFAVWRSSTGTYYVMRSSNGVVTGQMFGSGGLGDIPLASLYVR